MNDLLKQYFGYDEFRPGQKEIIQKVIDQENVLGIMPTGSGKSICYQLPALLLDGLAVVVSPLISLMKDQVDAANQLGIPATFINSSLDGYETARRFQEIDRQQYRLLYIAPERFIMPDFIQAMKRWNVRMIAIDEAHCISQWGHDFRPSYLQMANQLYQLPNRPVIVALTATATVQVATDIKRLLKIPENNHIQTGFERENLRFQVIKDQKKEQYLIEYLKINKNQSGIIYAATRKEVDRLYHLLKKFDFSVGRYHGGLNENERTEMQEAFLYDRLQLIVATNAFGMGINKSNVRFVIHYQIPGSLEAYYQEAGRAGRDGLSSEAILLFSPQDIQVQKFFIQQSQREEGQKQKEYEKLKAMTEYVYIESCLQQYILNYFGETSSPCNRCGNCLDDREIVEVTTEAQMVLSCLKRMGENYGKQMLMKVLAGSKEQKLQALGFGHLSTYGLMKNQSQKETMQLIEYLISNGYLLTINGEYPVLKVTERGIQVLKGQESVYRKEPKKVQQLSDEETDTLFEVLRELRTDLASEAGVPPYVVFSDSTLKEMSRIRPSSRLEMLQIKGVGQSKLDKYGEAFLSRIKNADSNVLDK
ncbi:TPA: DNA helicase RecQ [Enterococcus faecium]|uniref:DNA helicase RecQ n=1 Tax=Enterococcus faecium TaxID=1352 RepID=UPI00032FB22B|nr:DNA helicase RecQ [Enterococcus faecium]EOF58544.1 ATP-dependent DNA helicase RecQ [Enterococcus faecium EnGen0124]EOF62538.1 ATP-dependent DNA helicase RecQ [Enterococcus faecium EnGen0133]EOF66032.1 ATP-dependent DNA helicase RecQ [Enterococcus faecium EnGen0126]EOF71743.1 ATP-dependent DNA helicase RecQ [Enterococcus faecium EnGen0132]EOF74916.1 ATP-dependent DNA helicase RecQ [Enterococcus faecium EnGen0128]